MTFTNVMPAEDCDLQVKAVGDDTFTSIDNVTSIDGPDGSVGEKEITTLKSQTNAGGKEFKPTTTEAGHVSFSIEWDMNNVSHQKLATIFAARSMCSWQIVYANGGDLTMSAFQGFLTKFAPSGVDPDGVPTLAGEIRVNGGATIS